MSLLSSADVSISLNFHLICRFFTPRATCLLCLNWMWLPSIAKHWKPLKSIAKRAPPMFRLVANSSDCLPVTSPLFLNHIWICSQIIVGFVPRPSAHLFPISCGLGSNWEGGFAEQESTIFVAPRVPYFSSGEAFGPLAQWVQGTGVEGVARWLGDPFTGCAYTCNLCQPNARSIRNLCIHVERKHKKEQLFQILGPIVSITATMRGSRTPNKLLLLMAKAESIPLLLTTLWKAC